MHINYRIILHLLLCCMISNGFYAQCVASKPFDPNEILHFNDDVLREATSPENKKMMQNQWLHAQGNSVGIGVLIGVSTAAGSYCTEGYIPPFMHWLLWLAIFSKGFDAVSQNLLKKRIYHDPRNMSIVAAIVHGVSHFALAGYFGHL